MAATFPLTMHGQSGAIYNLECYPLGQRFNAVPGLYVFLAPGQPGYWIPVYIGETHDLDNRVGAGLANHHKVQAALAKGATHIGVRTAPADGAQRLWQERDLCAKWSPCCNGTPAPTGGLRFN